jgi:hypothetical protein
VCWSGNLDGFGRAVLNPAQPAIDKLAIRHHPVFGDTMVPVSNQLPATPPGDAPDALKAVWPLVLHWGLSDDVGRGDLTAAATDEELEVLVQTVNPLYPAINAYLNKNGNAEHAVPLRGLGPGGDGGEVRVGSSSFIGSSDPALGDAQDSAPDDDG